MINNLHKVIDFAHPRLDTEIRIETFLMVGAAVLPAVGVSV